MSCPRCRGTALVEIKMSLRDARVTLHSCTICETRWWDRDGEQVALGHVLSLASTG